MQLRWLATVVPCRPLLFLSPTATITMYISHIMSLYLYSLRILIVITVDFFNTFDHWSYSIFLLKIIFLL
jgi:hypothetical protein